MKYKETRTYTFEERMIPQALMALGGTAMHIKSFDNCIQVSRYWDNFECYCNAIKDLRLKGYSKLIVEHGAI